MHPHTESCQALRAIANSIGLTLSSAKATNTAQRSKNLNPSSAATKNPPMLKTDEIYTAAWSAEARDSFITAATR